MHKYKNVSSSEQTLTGAGDVRPRVVQAGGEVLSSFPIENPNFTYIGEAEQQTSNGITGTQVQQPNAVTDAQAVETPPQEGEQ
jgi:hypothetical protein